MFIQCLSFPGKINRNPSIGCFLGQIPASIVSAPKSTMDWKEPE